MSEENSKTSSSTSTTSCCLTPSPHNPEDQLIGLNSRTFTQLLANQLGILEGKETPPEEQKRQSVEPKPFLRRGTGLTRFNLPPDPSQQPSQKKRSQSQPRVSQVKSRLSQETQSFANKKTVSKRSVSISPAMCKRKPESPVDSPKKNFLTINPYTILGSQRDRPGKVNLGSTLKDKFKINENIGSIRNKELVLSEMPTNYLTG